MDKIIYETYKDMTPEYLNDLAVKIKLTYSWNSDMNNWNGHKFVAPNGWKIITDTIKGMFAPEGEIVSIYNGEEKIGKFSYYVRASDEYYSVLENLRKKMDISISRDVSTAVGEYIIGRALIEGNFYKGKEENKGPNTKKVEVVEESKGVPIAKIPIKRIRIEWKNIRDKQPAPNGFIFFYQGMSIYVRFEYDINKSTKKAYKVFIYNKYYPKEDIIADIDKNSLDIKGILKFDLYPGDNSNNETMYRKARMEELELDRSKNAEEREVQIICEYIDKILDKHSTISFRKVDSDTFEKIENLQLEPKEFHSYDYADFSIYAYHFSNGYSLYPEKITFYIYKEKIPKEKIVDGEERIKHPIWDEVTYSLDGSIDDRYSNYFRKRKKELSKNYNITGWNAIYRIECEIIEKLFNL